MADEEMPKIRRFSSAFKSQLRRGMEDYHKRKKNL